MIYETQTQEEAYAIIGMSYLLPNTSEYDLFEDLRGQMDFAKELDRHRKEQIIDYYNSSDPSEPFTFTQGAFLSDLDTFDSKFFKIPPKEASLMDPAQRKLLETAYHAFEDAGYAADSLRGSKTGVYIGYATFVQSNYGLMAYSIDKTLLSDGMVGNISALMPSRISYFLDLKGPNMLLDTACASSLTALYHACEGIKNNDCDMAFVGGVRVNLLPVENEYLNIGVQSTDFVTRAFDETSDGTGVGEGIGGLVIKKLSKALEEKNHIHAVIRGIATNHNGASIGITAPNADAQTAVLTKAWAKAKIHPEDLAFLQTHGTGTKLGDTLEIQGIQNAFRQFTDKKNICAISNVKSNMGHLFEASGMLSIIASILALKNHVIFPTIHITQPNRQIDFVNSPVYVNTKLRYLDSGKKLLCGISSFGLSGTNCHMVLEEAPQVEKEEYTEGMHMLVISAKSEYSLKAMVTSYIRCFDLIEGSAYRICYTSQVGRTHYNYRIAVLGKTREELVSRLMEWQNDNAGDKICYGVHKIVTANKKERLENEYTLEEIEQESRIAAKYVKILNKLSGEKKEQVLAEIAKLYVKGADIKFYDLYHDSHPYTTVLPYYVFEKEHLWLPAAKKNNFQIRWECMQEVVGVSCGKEKWNYISVGKSSIQKTFLKYFKTEAEEVISYELLQLVPEQLKLDANHSTNLMFDLSGLSYSVCERDIAGFHEICGKIYAILQNYCNRSNENSQIRIRFIGKRAFHIIDQDSSNPFQCAVLSLAKSIQKDCPFVDICSYDIDSDMHSKKKAAVLCARQQTESYYALRNGELFHQVFGECEAEKKEVKLRKNGVYVFTGGIGGIALTLAEYFCTLELVHVVLLTRRTMPPSEIWERVANDLSCSACEREKISDLIRIRQKAVSIEIISCDVADQVAVKKAIGSIRSAYGTIDGIIHAAGISRDVKITDRNGELLFADIIKAKVDGTINLHRAVRKDPLQFFIMCSSIATVFSAAGQSDYLIGNAFLDEFAWYRKERGLQAKTINWCTWKDKGMAHDSGFTVDTIFKAMSCDAAVQGFADALRTDMPRIHVGYLNEKGGLNLLKKSKVSVYGRLKEQMDKLSKESGQSRDSSYVGRESDVLRLKGRIKNDYTHMEQAVGIVFATVLGLKELDIYDNFFEMGMDSISGIKIAQLLSEKFHMELNVVDILKHNCLYAYCSFLDQFDLPGLGVAKPHIEQNMQNSEREGRYPLSPSQRGIYLLYKVQERNTNYNVSNVVMMEEKIDYEKARKAFQKLISRHAMLRVSFHDEDGELYQEIHNHVETDIDYLCMEEEEVKEQFAEIYDRFVKPFELDQPPLIRFQLIHVDNKSIVMYDIHHIVTDGISNEILIRDFLDFYLERDIKPLKHSYIEHIEEFFEKYHTSALAQQEQFWIEKLNAPLPVIDLPTKHGRSSRITHEGAHQYFEIDERTTLQLKQLCVKQNVTLFMMLYAVLNLTLYRYSGQKDIIIGSPTVGRKDKYADVVGMFVNTVVIRNNIDMHCSFTEYIMQVKESILDSFRNQDYPFSYLVEKLGGRRDLDRNPVFDIMFVLQNYGIDRTKGGLFGKVNSQAHTVYNKSSKFDISFAAVDEEKEIVFDVEYNVQLYNDSMIERMIADYKAVIGEVLRCPDRKLLEMDLMADSQKQLILEQLQENSCSYNEKVTLDECFAAAVCDYRHKTAIIYHDQSYTYEELGDWVYRFANYLKERGFQRGDRIAIYQERNVDTVIAIFAVLACGCVFVPIDMEAPTDRIVYQLEDSGAKAVLVNHEHWKELPQDKEYIDMTKLDLSAYETVITLNNASDDLAYIMYTSGTTGIPKGVMLEHKNIVAFIAGFYKEFGFRPGRIMLQQYSYAFDGYNEEVYTTLCAGGTLVIVDKEEVLDMRKLDAIVTEYKVDTISVSAVLFAQIGRYMKNPYLKTVISGGDVMKPEFIESYSAEIELYNSYGPTEASCCATYYRVDHEKKDIIPIGRNLANYGVYILDDGLRLNPVDVPGEICISGNGVARGYLNKPELTQKAFVYCPMIGQVVYRTGDIGKYGEDGNIYFLGRKDRQIKIRGFRIEASEVERYVKQYVDADALYVCAVEDKDHNKELCCYIVSDEEIDRKELKNHLMRHLPGYMIPQYFVKIGQMPYNKNDKIDVIALPKPKQEDGVLAVYVAPRTELERKIAKVYSDVLGLERIGMEDNFFDVGGNSIKAIEILSKLQAMGYLVDIHMIFQYQDVETLAKEILLLDRNVVAQKLRYLKERAVLDSIRLKEQYEADEEIAVRRNQYFAETEKIKFHGWKTKKYKQVLLLGATGYLGAYILNGLLQRGIEAIHCIVRAKDEQEGFARVKSNFEYYFDDCRLLEKQNSIHVLCGDVSIKRFGLADDVYEELVLELDCIINCAALVKHFGRYEDFRKANVDTVKNCITLKNRSHQIEFHHISTVSVGSGYIENKQYDIFTESDVDIGQIGDNNYVNSKIEAERYIQSEREKENRITVYRVGNLVFDSNNGRFQKNMESSAFYNTVRSVIQLGKIPRIHDIELDFSYVNETADAILSVFDKEELLGQNWHLYQTHPVCMVDFAQMINETGRFTIDIMEPNAFYTFLEDHLEDKNYRNLIHNVISATGMLNQQKQITSIYVQNEKTKKMMEALHYQWSELSTHDVEKMLRYCVENNFLP